MGRSGRYEIRSRLEVLLTHLLNWEFQPSKRTNSWRLTLLEQRIRIAGVIEESPSLRSYPADALERAYILGLNEAITETSLPEPSFPPTCPYTIGQVLDPSFLPGHRGRTMNRIDLKQPAGYDEDFALWSAEQAGLIRAGRLDRLDLDNLAEEIDSLGRSEEHQIDSRLEVLLQHLLKWQFQPEKRTRSWAASILEQRIRIGPRPEAQP